MIVYVKYMIVCVIMTLPLIFVVVHDKIRPDKEIEMSLFSVMITIVPFAVSLFLMLLFTIVVVSDRHIIRDYYREKQRLESVSDGYEQAIYEASRLNEKLKGLMFVDKIEREHILSNPIDTDMIRRREYESFRGREEND